MGVAKTSKTSGGSRRRKSSAKVSARTSRVKAAGSPKGRGATRKAKPAPRKVARAGKKKTHLSKKELTEFQEMLLEKRRQLVGDLTGMEAQAISELGGGNLSSMPTDMADVGTDNFEREFTLGLLESEQVLLREIDEALGRIEDRTYGICLGTGEPIPKARLRAKPWAKYTVEYTRMLEKGLVRLPEHEEGQERREDEAENEDREEADEEDEE
jgi:DnaK suppressor protein